LIGWVISNLVKGWFGQFPNQHSRHFLSLFPCLPGGWRHFWLFWSDYKLFSFKYSYFSILIPL
jgi:hypothetical protein